MPKKIKKVLTFGTFDLFHEGHKSYLNQAKALGDELFVCVARDQNIEKHKGKKANWPEKKRKEVVANNFPEAHVLLGFLRNIYKCVFDIEPDIIALGYDQTIFTDKLSEELEKKGLKKTKIVRLKPFKPEKYKTSIIKLKK